MKYESERVVKPKDRVFVKNAQGKLAVGNVTDVHEKERQLSVKIDDKTVRVDVNACAHVDDYNAGKSNLQPEIGSQPPSEAPAVPPEKEQADGSDEAAGD